MQVMIKKKINVAVSNLVIRCIVLSYKYNKSMVALQVGRVCLPSKTILCFLNDSESTSGGKNLNEVALSPDSYRDGLWTKPVLFF